MRRDARARARLGLSALAWGLAVYGAAPARAGSEASDASPVALLSGADCAALLAEQQDEVLQEVGRRADEARAAAAIALGLPVVEVNPPFSEGAPFVELPPDGRAAVSVEPAEPGCSPLVEADIAQDDRGRAYLLHGSSLLVADAQSPAALRLLSSTPLEGNPLGLIVQAGRAAVFSHVFWPLPGHEPPVPIYGFAPTYTKVTVLDVSGDAPLVLREAYVEGRFLSAWQDGSVVRGALRGDPRIVVYPPSLTYADPFGRQLSFEQIEAQIELWASQAIESIATSQLEHYLPSLLEVVGGTLIEAPLDCASYWLPQPGTSQRSYTRLFALDLAADAEPVAHTTVLGYGMYVGVGADAAVLLQHDFRYYTGQLDAPQTIVHRFELEAQGPRYTVSGSVAGLIPNNLALSQRGGVTRLFSVEEQRVPAPGAEGQFFREHPGRFVTLEPAGGELVERGRSEALPTQASVYPVRFAGERAYFSAYGMPPELVVVDLTEPSAPAVLGRGPALDNIALLFPLQSGHLLSVGERSDSDPPVAKWSLGLLDVGDPSAPRVSAEYLYATPPALGARMDLRSLAFDTTTGTLAFAIESPATASTTLELFRIGPGVGVTRLAGLAPELPEPTLEDCLALLGYPTDPEFVATVQANADLESSILLDCEYAARPQLRRASFRAGALQLSTSRSLSLHALEGLDGPALGLLLLPPG